MKVKTSVLDGEQLATAVQIAFGFTYQRGMPPSEWSASAECTAGMWRRSPHGHWGCVRCSPDEYDAHDMHGLMQAHKIETYYHEALEMWAAKCEGNLRYGPTPRVAVGRAFVASKLGEEVELP